MSNIQTTGNATKQPTPQYPPAMSLGGGMGGMGGFGSPFGIQKEMMDTVNSLRDKVIELDSKITILTALIKK
jgi:hypothetical protein